MNDLKKVTKTGTDVPRGTIENLDVKVTETIEQKIARVKLEHKAMIAKFEAEKAEMEAKLAEIKAEQKRAEEELKNGSEREKMAKFAALVAIGKVEIKENKTEVILDCMMKNYTKDAILAYTGYTVKEVTDITWRIYESYGCNSNR